MDELRTFAKRAPYQVLGPGTQMVDMPPVQLILSPMPKFFLDNVLQDSPSAGEGHYPPSECSRKKRSISLVASGP